MCDPSQNNPGGLNAIPREEFEKFLLIFTHEIRNRLNGIALEAADLTEQAGLTADSPADGLRLQQQVQECSAFLRKVRETLAPDDPQATKTTLADFTKKLRKQNP